MSFSFASYGLQLLLDKAMVLMCYIFTVGTLVFVPTKKLNCTYTLFFCSLIISSMMVY
ncbi:hypothetical protein BGW37DRAFT_498568 [Umbelopsis sp. PMI_123]|nr:hypothetical protein BGW37DRAFT_498568 [Umbelopsis sp. PMI_123]